jgi:hypothetical protein
VCAALAAAGGCTCGQATLSVDLEVAPRAVTTRCVTVVARASGMPDESTEPLSRDGGKSSFTVAVFQGGLPDNVSVLARGFEDPDCTRLNEESIPNAVRFVRGQVTPVSLRLEGSPCAGADAGTPCLSGVCRSDGACADAGTEFDCTNGTDDDGDGRSDCRDSDCVTVACVPANQCVVGATCLADGGCRGGAPRSCDVPPGFCYGTPGTCSPANGVCSYVPDAGIVCDDSDLCTQTDHCQPDAGCSGTPVVCNMPPPGACFDPTGTCDRDAGCLYSIRVDAGCNDGDLCTFKDRCSADGGCDGQPYSCPSTECGASNCLGDGNCSPPQALTGQLCDSGNGVCSAAGTCLEFPYVPANFNPTTIAPTLVLPDGGVRGSIDLSCSAWFNSTDGGFGWCGGQPLPSVTAITQVGSTTPAVVLGMTDLTVSGSLQLFGNRQVILAVFGDVTVTSTGTISARSAMGNDAGSGAISAGTCGAQNGSVASMSVGTGGGGGSYGTGGGSGGDLTGAGGAMGGNGGGSYGGGTLTPLLTGCGGGSGGRPNDTANAGGNGGAGGGGVQISAAGLLNITGTVTASGAGGQGGLKDMSGGGEGGNGGGGGGSGGAVLLEGQDILIPIGARLTANGGGGGEGGDGDSTKSNGNPGGDGPTTSAAGGAAGAGPSTAAATAPQEGSPRQVPEAPPAWATSMPAAAPGAAAARPGRSG